MDIEQLQTPCILLDEHRFMANIRAMQSKADLQNVALRPHVKTHKSLELARLQLQHGARGVTVAKVGEAEVFANNGIDDVRIAYTVIGRQKWERIAQLMPKAEVSFCIDSTEGAQGASDYFSSVGKQARVLVEVDAGYGRCGVRWDDSESVEFYKWADSLPGLTVLGILTHAGQSYRGPTAGQSKKESLRAHACNERDRMLEFALEVEQAGAAVSEISIGSTPTMSQFDNVERGGRSITEIRPGNYIFNDAIQVALGAADWNECALTVLATVVSIKTQSTGSETVFLDAGKKILTTDQGFETDGFGTILYNPRVMTPMPHARISGLSEEHAWVSVRGGSTLSIGDRVQIVPNHSCVVASTQHTLHVVRDGVVDRGIKTDAIHRSD